MDETYSHFNLAQNYGFTLRYLDNHVLVVDKPAGMLSQQDASGAMDVLRQAKSFIKDAYQKPGAVYLGLLHRLDRNVSGVMVLARTSKAASRLSEQIRRHDVKKTYLALLAHAPPNPGQWEDYLKKTDQKSSVVSSQTEGARLARLQLMPLEHKGKRWLVEIGLQTGRYHQIRCQCAHRGVPLCGDRRYGSTKPFVDRFLALHCLAMTVEHPTKRVPLSFYAPLPGYWPAWTIRCSHDLIEARR